MAKNLVIVESPAKAHTIEKYLGSDYKVLASVGHIRKDTKVDKATFDVTYEIDPGHKAIITELKREAAKADRVWLATDEDREGESISWHLCEVLKLPKDTARITFHEITKPALEHAILHPRTVDMDMVSSQQARQTLDMLVGYDLSDVVRRKVPGAISAGRVQSPALRLIVEREKEIEKFDSKYSFKISGNFNATGKQISGAMPNSEQSFTAKGEVVIFDGFLRVYGKSKDLELPKVTKGDILAVNELTAKQTYAKPPARYTEGSLVKKLEELGIGRPSTYASIMTAIQARKYVEKGESEGAEREITEFTVGNDAKAGFIATYDGKAPESEGTARELLEKLSGSEFVVESVEETEGSKANPVPFTTAALQIEANAKLGFSSRTTMSAAQGLYQAGLITYHRTDSLNLSSQAIGAISKFIEEKFGKNYLKVRHFKTKDASAQEAHEAIRPTDVFRTAAGKNNYEKRLYQLIWARTVATQMANAKVAKTTIKISAVKGGVSKLENVKRKTVKEKYGANKGRLIPTAIGELVSGFLTDNFKNIVDYKFTANIEKDLDLVADAKLERVKMLRDFYGPFRDTVLMANGVERYNNARLLGHHPETGQPIYAKVGKTGGFIQLGDNEKEAGEKPRFAPLPKRKSAKTVTLEQALKQLALPALPRTLGKAPDGAELIAANGPFGPYLKGGKYNIPIKDYDPYTISLEQALPLYQKKVDSIIADWGDVLIINGAYGPYVKGPGRRNNAKIPKDTDPKSITEAKAREMLENKPKTTRRGARGGRKKTTKKATAKKAKSK